MSLNSQYNKQTGELEIPFVELDSTADKQFKHANKRKKYLPYPSFLEAVDHHYSNTFAPIDDEEYEIKLHTHVHTKTLRSTKSKKLRSKKVIEKNFIYRKRVLKHVHTRLLQNNYITKLVV